MAALGRAGLWLLSLLLAAGLFSLLTLPLFSSNSSHLWTFLNTIRVSGILAGPAWLVFLPLVIGLKDSEGRRFWILLGNGIVVGPASVLAASLCGVTIDPLLGGIAPFFLPALVVGSLTTLFYLARLRLSFRVRSFRG